MSSPFIEGSKHGELTKQVEDHFFSGSDPKRVNKTPNSGTSAMPARDKDFPFNVETGVNYTPPERAGHKV
jgi:hypothetical protein